METLDCRIRFFDGEYSLMGTMEALDERHHIVWSSEPPLRQGNFQLPDLRGVAGFNEEIATAVGYSQRRRSASKAFMSSVRDCNVALTWS